LRLDHGQRQHRRQRRIRRAAARRQNRTTGFGGPRVGSRNRAADGRRPGGLSFGNLGSAGADQQRGQQEREAFQHIFR
jgi:hypothetical protein